jgi:hypothetical protein
MNAIKARLERMISYRDSYGGISVAEARARNNAVKELWASLPHQTDRNKYRKAAGIVT